MSKLSIRIGLVPRIVLLSTGILAAALIVVSGWSHWKAEQQEWARAEQRLDRGAQTLRDALAPLGEHWSLDAEGRLRRGQAVVNGRSDIVDLASRSLGGVATIFAGETRVATSIVNAQGQRAVGTALAPGAAHSAAVGRGETFRGVNTILGRDHLTIYEPIRDAAGRQVGLIFVGLPLQELYAGLAQRRRSALLLGVAVLLVATLVCVLVLHLTLRPLSALTARLRGISAGELAAPGAGIERGDEIGDVARAVDVLRVAPGVPPPSRPRPRRSVPQRPPSGAPAGSRRRTASPRTWANARRRSTRVPETCRPPRRRCVRRPATRRAARNGWAIMPTWLRATSRLSRSPLSSSARR